MKVKVQARLSFPALFEAEQYQGAGEFNYSAQFIIEEGSESDTLVRDAINQVATEKWKEKAPAVLKGIKNNKMLCCYTDGDISGYDGHMVLSAKRKEKDGRPDVRDRNAAPLTERDGKPYAGCYVIGILDIWAQDNNFGKGVRGNLMGVQFVKDGQAFSKTAKAKDDDFADLGVLEEDEMFS